MGSSLFSSLSLWCFLIRRPPFRPVLAFFSWTSANLPLLNLIVILGEKKRRLAQVLIPFLNPQNKSTYSSWQPRWSFKLGLTAPDQESEYRETEGRRARQNLKRSPNILWPSPSDRDTVSLDKDRLYLPKENKRRVKPIYARKYVQINMYVKIHQTQSTPTTKKFGGIIWVFTRNGLPTFTKDKEKACLLVLKRRGGIKNQAWTPK